MPVEALYGILPVLSAGSFSAGLLLSLFILSLLGGCTSPPAELPTVSDAAQVVYVLGHGWHTGLVVRRADIPDGMWPEQADFPAAQYLEVGWGDRDFYQAPEPTFSLGLKAALRSTASVLHVVGFAMPPEDYFAASEVIAVRLFPPGFAHLVTFIHQTYKRDAHGRAIPLGPGWYEHSQFYLATGTYHLFNTCNTWVAKALQAAGAPMRPGSALTAGSVMEQVRAFGSIMRAK
jgi:uncharacterized protein (TIGR02117 family)